MVFNEAIKKLNIEDYGERIFNSNSHGELYHCTDYIVLAGLNNMGWFRDWFVALVAEAEKTWSRPESIFQHIPQCLEASRPKL